MQVVELDKTNVSVSAHPWPSAFSLLLLPDYEISDVADLKNTTRTPVRALRLGGQIVTKARAPFKGTGSARLDERRRGLEGPVEA